MRLHQFLLLTSLSLLNSSFVSAQAPTSPVTTYPNCRAEQLSLRTDSREGELNGMSHSGVILTLRNTGTAICEIQAIPTLVFADSTHELHVQAQSALPRFVHPGPVIVPLAVPPGAEATSTLQWVSGPVFEDNTCLDPSRLSIIIEGKALSASFHGHLCGERTKGVFYRVGRFTLKASS